MLQRVELTLSRGGRDREVDVYECYWAPKTEGAVKLRHVIDFLRDGGSRGLINSFVKFQRALFDTMVPFLVTWRTPTYLQMTLAVLAGLMLINAIILATGTTLAGIGHLNASLVAPLTAIAALVSASAITFGVVLFLAEASKPINSLSRWGYTIRNVTWIGIGFTIAVIISGAAGMGLIFYRQWIPGWLACEARDQLNCPATHLQTMVNVLIFFSLLYYWPLFPGCLEENRCLKLKRRGPELLSM